MTQSFESLKDRSTILPLPPLPTFPQEPEPQQQHPHPPNGIGIVFLCSVMVVLLTWIIDSKYNANMLFAAVVGLCFLFGLIVGIVFPSFSENLYCRLFGEIQ
jgi:apolipoprotein N-acyltransferase